MYLTTKEIIDLAECVGLKIIEKPSGDELEAEFLLQQNRAGGIVVFDMVERKLKQLRKECAMYTKGPWKLAEDGSPFVYKLNDRGSNIFWFNVSSPNCGNSSWPDEAGKKELLANARLAAKAPELLEALEEVVSELKQINQFGAVDFSATIKSCDELIAKAKGE